MYKFVSAKFKYMQPMIKQGWLRALIFTICLLVFIFFAGKAMQFMNFHPTAQPGAGSRMSAEQYLYLGLILSSVLSYLVVLFFRKIVDRQPVADLGLEWHNRKAHAATGFFLGLLLLGIGTLLLVTTGNLEWTDIFPDGRSLFVSLGLMAMIAFTEELVFRGYILNNLMQSMNKWNALLLSALVFALFHGGNPGIHVIALVNLFVGGLLLGINYVFTKNLWFGILLHFSWNYYQGPVLGYEASGIHLNGLLQQERTGNSLMTGGLFGFEGSILCGVLALLAAVTLGYAYTKKRLKFEA